MMHLNGNLLCTIDCETTGLDYYKHNIWQFTCLPLDYRLDQHKEIGPFDIKLRPETGVFDTRALSKKSFDDALIHGIPQEVGANLFHEWFERLPLGHKKRICVLGHNWPFDREFIRHWLGPDSFEYYFDPRYRDTMALGAAINDGCDFSADRVPFPALKLSSMCYRLGLEWDTKCAHNSLYDAVKTAKLYKKLITTMEFIHETSTQFEIR